MKLSEIMEKEYETLSQINQKDVLKKKDIVSHLLDVTRNLFEQLIRRSESWEIMEIYKSMNSYLKNKLQKAEEITPERITEFSVRLAELQNEILFEKSGTILSALINFHYENTHYKEEYIIVTNHLEKKVDYLAFNLKGNMRIRGDSHDFFAVEMEKGSIIVEGNVNEIMYHFSGKIQVLGNALNRITTNDPDSLLIIEKDAHGSIGSWTKGRTIILKGNALEDVGFQMGAGDITIYGNVSRHVGFDMRGGKISVGNGVNGSVSTQNRRGTITICGYAQDLEDNTKKYNLYNCKSTIRYNGKQLCPRET